MRHVIRQLISFSILVVGAWATGQAAAQCVSLTTAGSAYTQNFDTLSNVAGSTTNSLTLTGWFHTESGGGVRDNEQYAVDTAHPTPVIRIATVPQRVPSGRWAAIVAAR